MGNQKRNLVVVKNTFTYLLLGRGCDPPHFFSCVFIVDKNSTKEQYRDSFKKI